MSELSPPVDELAARRVRRLDADAFVALLERHDVSHRRLAFRLLGDRDRMDDVLQEAYIRAFRALPRFRGDSSVETWLYRIVYNACVDDLRRHRAHETLDEWDECLAAAPTKPEARLCRPCRPPSRAARGRAAHRRGGADLRGGGDGPRRSGRDDRLPP